MIELKKTVYFIRHGQSEGNVSAVFQAPDSPLNDKGKKQAEDVAERISKIPFETLIASPLSRTKTTAETIERATGKKAEFSELFVERVKPTRINGKSYSDAEAQVISEQWEKSLHTSGMRVEDGENFDDLVKRADDALDFLKNKSESSMVVVTHGYFLKMMVARVLLGELLSGETFRKIQKSTGTENTGITVLRYSSFDGKEPRWSLWIFNDHAHLG